MVGVRAAAVVAMSFMVAACAGDWPTSTPGRGSGTATQTTATQTTAPSTSPPALADRVVDAVSSGRWTGTFRLSGTITLKQGTARPVVQLVRGSFEIVGHDSSSFVEVTKGATTRSTEVVIVGSQAWRRDNGGTAYPVRDGTCLDFPDMLGHATAMVEDGLAGSHAGLPVSRLQVTDYATPDCGQGFTLAVLVTPSPKLVGLSIDRTRTLAVKGHTTVEVTALEATWWAATAAIVPPARTWQRVDDTLDMLEIELPDTWRAGAQSGVEVLSDPRTGVGIRILTTSGDDRTLSVVVARERATLMKLQRFVLASSTQTEVGGFPAQLLAFHFVANGHQQFGIRAIAVHCGLVTDLTWTRQAGHEAADEQLFRAILGTIDFYG